MEFCMDYSRKHLSGSHSVTLPYNVILSTDYSLKHDGIIVTAKSLAFIVCVCVWSERYTYTSTWRRILYRMEMRAGLCLKCNLYDCVIRVLRTLDSPAQLVDVSEESVWPGYNIYGIQDNTLCWNICFMSLDVWMGIFQELFQNLTG